MKIQQMGKIDTFAEIEKGANLDEVLEVVDSLLEEFGLEVAFDPYESKFKIVFNEGSF